jgi:hypothetical protein
MEPKLNSYGELIMAQLLGTIPGFDQDKSGRVPAIGFTPMMETCLYRFTSGLNRPDKRNVNFLLSNKSHSTTIGSGI